MATNSGSRQQQQMGNQLATKIIDGKRQMATSGGSRQQQQMGNQLATK